MILYKNNILQLYIKINHKIVPQRKKQKTSKHQSHSEEDINECFRLQKNKSDIVITKTNKQTQNKNFAIENL